MRSRTIIDSFRYAISGMIYCIKTQRNIRIHCVAALGALLLSYLYHLSRVELMILFFTITLVIITEMLNTAIEKVVDLIVDSYHPLAKIAKDVAAGAVILAALNAIGVAVVLFCSKHRMFRTVTNIFMMAKRSPLHAAVVLILLALLVILLIKVIFEKNEP